MKVILINGSPHASGCTHRALKEIENVLNSYDIETEMIQVGHLALRGCIACGKCRELKQCVFDDEVNRVAKKLEESDGMVVGSPVYYSSPNGTLLSFLDRLFYSSALTDKRMKVGASIVSARRAGTTASFDVLNKYFSISNMPIVTSQYWNNVHGNTEEQVECDLEGLQTMRTLAHNMAFLMKSIQLGKEVYGLPEKERKIATNYIR